MSDELPPGMVPREEITEVRCTTCGEKPRREFVAIEKQPGLSERWVCDCGAWEAFLSKVMPSNIPERWETEYPKDE